MDNKFDEEFEFNDDFEDKNQIDKILFNNFNLKDMALLFQSKIL